MLHKLLLYNIYERLMSPVVHLWQYDAALRQYQALLTYILIYCYPLMQPLYKSLRLKAHVFKRWPRV